MDKIRKIGLWLWFNKERMLLLVAVGFLFWAMYQVMWPTKTGPVAPIRPPSQEMPTPEELNIPAPPPVAASPPPRQDWSRLYVQNPWWYYSQPGTSEGSQNQESNAPQIRLLKIRTLPDGRAQAELLTKARKWYWEDEKFESFELLDIDPEAGTCEVYSEDLGKTITLKIEQ